MKYLRLFLLTVWLVLSATVTADEDEGPFDFLFDRCEETGVSDLSVCVRGLYRAVLDDSRPQFSTGFPIGNEIVVLEPWKMHKLKGSRQSRSSKLEVSSAHLSGLSKVQLDSVMLTNNAVAAKMSFPELTGEMKGKIRYGFLPFKVTLNLKLLNPTLMVGSKWTSSGGDLDLEEPHAKLWLDGYNITISGLTSMGTTLATKLNENHKEIIEFMKPSLEAAIVRQITKTDQQGRRAALDWLKSLLGES